MARYTVTGAKLVNGVEVSDKVSFTLEAKITTQLRCSDPPEKHQIWIALPGGAVMDVEFLTHQAALAEYTALQTALALL